MAVIAVAGGVGALSGVALSEGERHTFTGDDRADVQKGSAQSDSLSGRGDGDYLRGLGGPDRIDGGDGDDALVGDEPATGSAADTLTAGAGADEVAGGGGNDTITGGPGGDRLGNMDFGTIGGPFVQEHGDDTISGEAGDDFIDADSGADRVSGGDGHDLLEAGPGADTVEGGPGRDYVLADPRGTFDADTDTVLEGPGDDTIDGGSGNGRTIDGTTPQGSDRVSYRAAPDAIVLSLGGGTASGWGSDTLTNIEHADGSDFPLEGDSLTGSALKNDLRGLRGDDTLIGLAGDDRLDGGDGTDTASYAPSGTAVTASLVTGTSTGVGADTLVSIENLTGGPGGDSLTGSASANRLVGGAGDDKLDGGDGHDELISGAGNDELKGGPGADTVNYSETEAPLAIALDRGTTRQAGTTGFAADDTLTDVENAVGGRVGDHILGSDGANVLDGLGGDDTINGGRGHDTFRGGDGNDRIGARDGVDGESVSCGAGADDKAYVDAGDIVASDCETVEKPAPAPTSPPPPPADDGGSTPPPSADGGGSTPPPPADGGGSTPPADGGGSTPPPPADGGAIPGGGTPAQDAPIDVTAPLVTIGKPRGRLSVKKGKKTRLTFALKANESDVRFECSVGRAAFAPCRSRFTAKLRAGKHKIRVRAIDAAGNAGPVKSRTVKVGVTKKKGRR